VIGLYALNFWLPQMIRGVGDFSYLQVGLLVAIPSGLSGLAMIGWGLRSDRRGERRWHVAIPAMAAALVFAVAALAGGSAAISVAAVGLGMVLICAALPVFWTLPAALLSGAAAAGGIALVNSIGNLGGFFGPFVTGSLKELTGSFAPALWILAASLACASLIVLRIGRGLDPRTAARAAQDECAAR
jgi:ACS family tartrate transporter-like MFS transporter